VDCRLWTSIYPCSKKVAKKLKRSAKKTIVFSAQGCRGSGRPLHPMKIKLTD
jgi:hypothetical protein